MRCSALSKIAHRARVIMTRAAMLLLLITLTVISANTYAATSYSDFFSAPTPEHLSLSVFVATIGAESRYAATHEGLELEQTLNPYVSLVGRVSGYQIYQGDGWDWPLVGHGSRPRNFGVLQAGFDLLPWQGTSFKILGGGDVGDSDRARIEGDFSTWLWLHSRHPVNLAFIGDHFYNNGLSSGALDIRTVVASSGTTIWLFGAGGQLWGGGPEPHVMKEFGPDLGIVLRRWKITLDFQAGYGNNHGYGIIGVSRHFGFDEN
jgi:hypothetical protein